MSLVALPLNSGRFVLINPDYIVHIWPQDGYCDVNLSTGAICSVEGTEEQVKDAIRQASLASLAEDHMLIAQIAACLEECDECGEIDCECEVEDDSEG